MLEIYLFWFPVKIYYLYSCSPEHICVPMNKDHYKPPPVILLTYFLVLISSFVASTVSFCIFYCYSVVAFYLKFLLVTINQACLLYYTVLRCLSAKVCISLLLKMVTLLPVKDCLAKYSEYFCLCIILLTRVIWFFFTWKKALFF